MYETRLKKLSELPDISKLTIDEHGLPRDWSFSFSNYEEGFGHKNKWHICITHSDLTADVYPLPEAVTILVNWNRKWEREELQRKFHDLLGI